MSTYFKVFLSIIFFSLPNVLLSNVTLNSLFSDRMIVQRETEIPIWGWADPNEKIFIEASWGVSAKTVTNEDGTWRAFIRTPAAGGPHMLIVSGKNTIKINDILSGEVWLCTGQSNMDFAMGKFVRDSREPKYQPLVEYIKNEIETVNEDWIRHIEVPQTTSLNKKNRNFNGAWVKANKDGISKITATGYFFAKELRNKLNVPIGLVECSWGGTRVQPWISKKAYLSDDNLKEFFQNNKKEIDALVKKMNAIDYVDTIYEQKLAKWIKNGEKGRKPKAKPHPEKDMQVAATLYNGMVNAIMPYKIKGAIWYQGESNAVYMPNEYGLFFKTMIKGWRADWGQGDFPFYWVQLAGCKRGNDKANKGWAIVNNELRKSLSTPNTGMAVLYDIGEAKDIHPHNKMDVGKRLSLWALAKDYEVKGIEVSGPLFSSYEVKQGKITVEFDHVGSGLMVGKKHLLEDVIVVDESLSWFEISGEDGVWKKAEASIVSKNKIEVWSASVVKPKHVRYAWSGYPEGANLYNKEGLPAAVFSTEE